MKRISFVVAALLIAVPLPAVVAMHDPDLRGDDTEKPVNVLKAGKIQVVEFLRFLQKVTGEIVVYPSTNPAPYFDHSATITVLVDVEPFTLAIAKAILEGNGYVIERKTIANGEYVYEVSHRAHKKSGGITDLGPVGGPGDFDPPVPAPSPIHDVPLKPFLQTLDDQLGMPVIYSAHPRGRKLEDTHLPIYGGKRAYDADTAKAILEIAGYTVIESFMEGRLIAQVHAPRRRIRGKVGTLVMTPTQQTSRQLLALLRGLLAPPTVEEEKPTGEIDDTPPPPSPVPGTFAYKRTATSLVFHGKEETLKALDEVLRKLDRAPAKKKAVERPQD